ncbi:unnamed protein product [Diatraea saccharalis]|uniref:C2H2-type domain-containing protein n=1 Tax=Diatraea saccharalis TaxID=40085 RepID=A0A9P0C8T1_9NEOP|nr:unnamed protein product [Diatraea saccharalis]
MCTLCYRQRKHSTLEMYKCPHCPERFGTYTRRAVHLAAEHQFSTRKYVCKICNRGFLISGNLSGHMRRAHAVARPHACAECGAAFPQRRELLAHGAAHRPSRPFHCQLCPNKYPRKKALVVHMRTHTNERRFACEVCGKRFLQKCTLLVHAKTHNRKEETCHNIGTVETEAVEYTFVKWTEVNKK